MHRSSWTVVNRFALSFIRLIHHVVIDQNQLRPSNESHNGAHLSFGFVSIPQMVNCRRLSLVRVAVSSLMSVFIQHRAVWVRDLFSIARTGGWAAPEKSQKKEGPTLAKLLARDLEPFHKKNTQLASHSLAGGANTPADIQSTSAACRLLCQSLGVFQSNFSTDPSNAGLFNKNK